MLVSYDEKNGFGGLFSSIEKLKQPPKITEDVKKFFEQQSLAILDTSKHLEKISLDYNLSNSKALDFAQGIRNGSIQLKDGQTMLQGYQAYLKSTSGALTLADIRTKALTVSMKVLSTVGWMAIFATASWAISKTIEAINNWIHADEKAIEAAEKAKGKIGEISSALKSNKETVEKCAKPYETLSQGIDRLNNKNINLSDEEYEEFLNISNQLADIFPTLVKGYDNNGNAILSLGQSGKSANAELQELLETQRQLANFKISQELPDVFNGLTVDIKNAQKELNSYITDANRASQGMEYINTLNGALSNFTPQNAYLQIDATNIGGEQYAQLIEDTLKEMGAYTQETMLNATTDYKGLTTQYYFNLFSLSKEQLQDLKDRIAVQSEDLVLALNESMNVASFGEKEIQNNMELMAKNFLPSLQEAISTSVNYSELNATGKKLADSLISSIDITSSLPMVKEQYGNDIQRFVIETIIYPIAKATPEVQRAYSKLLSINPQTISEDNMGEVDRLLDTIANYLGLERNELKIRLGFDSDGLGSGLKDKLKNIDLTSKTFSELFSNLPTDKLEEYVSLLKSGLIDEENISSFEKLNNIMEQTGTSASEAIKFMQKFSDSFELSSDLISDMQDTVDMIAEVKDEVKNTGEISNDSLASIAERFPEMENAVASFNQGLLSTNDFMELLQLAYENDASAFQTAMVAKLSGNEVFFSNIFNNNQQLFKGLAEAYGLDVNNWRTLAQAKASIDQELIHNLSSAWSKYYGVVIDSATGLAKITGSTVRHGSSQGVAFSSQEQGEAYAAALDAVSKANSLKRKLDEAAKIEIAVPNIGGIGGGHDGGNGGGGGGNGSGSSKEESKKEYDWIERAIESIERQKEVLQKQVDDETNSYRDQIAALRELAAVDEQFIALNKSAKETYATRWEKEKNELIKLFGDVAGNELISKIMSGNVSADKSTDNFSQEQSDLIDNAMKVYDDMVEADEKYEESIDDKLEHIAEIYKKRTEEAEAFVEQLSDELSQAESKLSIKETTGQVVFAEDYEKLISLSKEQTGAYYDQIDALEEELSTVEEGSSEYYSLMSSIASCEQSIAQCREQQAEWNEEIKNIPVRRIERYIELLRQIKQDLTNRISEQDSLGIATTVEQYGQLIDLTMSEIAKLLEQQELLKDNLSTYEYGSDKYNEAAIEIQNLDNDISDIIQSQNEWNNSILHLPIDKMEKLGDTLSAVSNALSQVADNNEAVISAVTGSIEKQVDSIEDLKESTTDAYAEQIDPLQEQLDLLQKANDERQIQLALESAQYALDKARNQRSAKVVRDGKVDYEANYDDIRNAEKEYADAQYNKLVHDLEKEIESLTEERDKLLEGYDLQIDKLNDIKSMWSSIADEIKLAADILKANEILGEGWLDKITSGDTSILEEFKKIYESSLNQKTDLDEEIKSNERVSEMMEAFVAKYQDGSISYEEAVAGIKKLQEQAKDGYSSQEYLDGLLSLNGSVDISSLLDKVNQETNNSLGQLADYMNVVKVNTDALADYTDTWEEMRNNISEQVEALKRIATELEKQGANKDYIPSKNHSSSGSGSSSGGGYESSGPGYINDVANGNKDAVDSWNSGNTGGASSELQEIINDKLQNRHNGIKSGPISKIEDNNDKLLKQFATETLKPNETLVKVLKGESIITEKQRNKLLENFKNVTPMMPSFMSAKIPDFIPVNRTPTDVNINMGDFVLPNVKNGEDFVRFLDMNFESVMRQNVSKIFR